MILTCPTCRPHEQDRIYGFKLRVANQMKKYPDKARCTVDRAELYIKGTPPKAETVVPVEDKKKKKKR